MSENDTKKKIVEASTYLFGVKGFDGTSTREIAKLAGVNIASLNYHFRSKQGLLQEVTTCVMQDFLVKIDELSKENIAHTAEFAVRLYQLLAEDGPKVLNHFKLFLDAQNGCSEVEHSPIGYEQFAFFLKKDLNENVPVSERLWVKNILFSYIMHSAVMSATDLGKKHIERHMPNKKDSIPTYITQLVETLIRDLNNRYK